MTDAVLIVQHTECREYKIIAAQLAPVELNAIGAAVLYALVSSGADVDGVIDAMKFVKVCSVDRDVSIPILLTGGQG